MLRDGADFFPKIAFLLGKRSFLGLYSYCAETLVLGLYSTLGSRWAFSPRTAFFPRPPVPIGPMSPCRVAMSVVSVGGPMDTACRLSEMITLRLDRR